MLKSVSKFESAQEDMSQNVYLTDCTQLTHSNECGEQGVQLLLKNDLVKALEWFREALAVNPNDCRHYLNRCYCYLRLDMNRLALAEAKRVLEKSMDLEYLFIANLRAGQASFALQSYKQAEAYFKLAVDINPESVHAQRELMRVKIARIVNMGFEEKDALLALEKFPSTLTAVNYLSKIDAKFSGLKNEPSYLTWHPDTVYSSDDESDCIGILNDMMNYKPGSLSVQHGIPKCPVDSSQFSTKSEGNESVFSDKQLAVSQNHRTIWIENAYNVTEDMLITHFSRFGDIISLKKLESQCAFVTFNTSNAISNVFKSRPHILLGLELYIFPVMTF